jgi:hypothetical protein
MDEVSVRTVVIERMKRRGMKLSWVYFAFAVV